MNATPRQERLRQLLHERLAKPVREEFDALLRAHGVSARVVPLPDSKPQIRAIGQSLTTATRSGAHTRNVRVRLNEAVEMAHERLRQLTGPISLLPERQPCVGLLILEQAPTPELLVAMLQIDREGLIFSRGTQFDLLIDIDGVMPDATFSLAWSTRPDA